MSILSNIIRQRSDLRGDQGIFATEVNMDVDTAFLLLEEIKNDQWLFSDGKQVIRILMERDVDGLVQLFKDASVCGLKIVIINGVLVR